MALQFHPEKNSALRDEFQRRSRAYQILSDEMKRHIYDQKGEEGLKDQPAIDSSVPPVAYYETFAIWDGDEEIELMDQQRWMDAGQSQEPWLVLFYSGRFTMVKELGEAWRQLSRRVHDWSRTAVIDCDQPGSIWVCKLNKIQSLPYIISFPSGGYNGMQRPIPFEKQHNFQNYIDFAFSNQQDFVFKLAPDAFLPNAKIDKAAQASSWLVGLCVTDESCVTLTHSLMEIAWITQASVTVGMLNCLVHRDFCASKFGVHVPAQNFGQDTPAAPVLFSLPNGLLSFPPENLHDEQNLEDASTIAIDVMKKNPKLNEMTVEKLTGIAANAIASSDPSQVSASELIKHIANTKHWKAEDVEYLILFYSPSSDYCQRPPPMFQPSTYGYTYKLNTCDRILRSFTGVSKWLNTQGRDLDRIGHVVPVTFDCLKDAAATELCNKLRHEKDLALPELVLLKDHGLNPLYYTGDLDRTDTVYAFLRASLGTKIHEIKEEDFNLHITNAPDKEKWMFYIMFYTGFSDASTKAMGEWHAASHFTDMPADVHMGKMNCEANFKLCQSLGVRNYPTFLLFINGVRHQFDYDYMNAIEFVRFAKDALNPIIHEFTPSEFRKTVWDSQAFGNSFGQGEQGVEVEKVGWVINFFAPWCVHCHTMAPLFESAGTVLKGIVRYGKLNCELEEGFCHSLAIMRYPTIRKYPAEPTRRSQATEYTVYHQPSPLSILHFSLNEVANHMLPMNTETFEKQVKLAREEDSWFVLFVGPQCVKCEEVGLQMHALSSRLFGRYQAKMQGVAKHGPEFTKRYEADTGIQLYTGQVDCGTESALCVGQGVTTFPSLVYFSSIRKTSISFFHPGVTGIDPPAHEDILEILAFVNDEVEKDRIRYNSPDRAHPLIQDTDYQFEFLTEEKFNFHSEL